MKRLLAGWLCLVACMGLALASDDMESVCLDYHVTVSNRGDHAFELVRSDLGHKDEFTGFYRENTHFPAHVDTSFTLLVGELNNQQDFYLEEVDGDHTTLKLTVRTSVRGKTIESRGQCAIITELHTFWNDRYAQSVSVQEGLRSQIDWVIDNKAIL